MPGAGHRRRIHSGSAFALVVVLLLSGCTTPSGGDRPDGAPAFAGPDPSRPGPSAVATAGYDLGVMQVSDPAGRTYPVRLLGEVVFPEAGQGPFPVVLVIHGRHGWCEGSGAALFDEVGVAHCRGLAPLIESVPSHLGHLELAEVLASHGFVVLLPELNDINAGDSRTLVGVGPAGSVPPNGDDGLGARNQVILRLLDELRALGAPPPGQPVPLPTALVGRVDVERVGLVGHSRGAEAVTHAPAYAAAVGHPAAGSIRAVFSIAGTPRPWMPEYPELRVPAGVPYASLVPYCDGDVWTLGNLEIHDEQVAAGVAGPLTQFVVMGANHNFYNTAWPEDDAEGRYDDDPYCAPAATGPGAGRMTPAEQIRFTAAYVPAFMRLHLGGDRTFAPLFTGAVAVPPFACPTEAPCPGRVHVSYVPEPARRVIVEDFAAPDAAEGNDVGGAAAVGGSPTANWCPVGAPCGVMPMAGAAPRLHFAWNGSAFLQMEIPAGAVELTGNVTFAFRTAVDAPSGSAVPALAVSVEDRRGREHKVEVAALSDALFVPPGTDAQRSVMHQVRVPLDVLGIAPGAVRAVTLHFSSEGSAAVFLSELLFYSE